MDSPEVTTQSQRPSTLNPWRRYFARILDLSIYGLMWAAVQYLLLRWQPPGGLFVTILINYIIFALMFVIEPLLLSTWGTTPGKALLGISVGKEGGGKLSYGDGFARVWGVFSRGFGYGIPIYNIVRLCKSYGAANRGETLEWDEGCEYKPRDIGALRVIGYCAAWLACFALAFFVLLQGQLPPHRGDITPQQFADNVNDAISRSGSQLGLCMTASGEWQKDGANTGTVYISLTESPDFELLVENDVVKGVGFEVKNSTSEWMGDYYFYKELITLSFLMAQRDYSCFDLVGNTELQALNSAMAQADYGFARDLASGVRVTSQLDYSGYENLDSTYFFPIVGQKQYFHLEFSMVRGDAAGGF